MIHCRKTRIVLWSPKGSTPSYYGGPTIGSYSLYRKRDPAATWVALAHGSARQPQHPDVFDEQHAIGALYFVNGHRPGGERSAADEVPPFPPTGCADRARHLVRKIIFAQRAGDWLKRHAGQFDVFHGLGLHIDTLAAAVRAEALGLPAVLTTVIESELTKGSLIATLSGAHRKRLRQLPRISAFVPISTRIRDRLMELGVPAERIVDVFLNRVDTDVFQPLDPSRSRSALRRELGFADKPTCLFAGAVDRRKRPHLLLRAIGALKARGLEVQLLIAGPAYDRGYGDAMRREAEALGISPQVVWLGFSRQVKALMQASDLLALPSADEGQPGAIAQAMACGLPCIFTDISSARDLIDDGENGRIIAPDAADLAAALHSYFSNPAKLRTHGLRARQKAVRAFSDANAFETYLRIFENVRRGRPAGA
jgi:glycosyltransferase involved in cell wall biosynthesis